MEKQEQQNKQIENTHRKEKQTDKTMLGYILIITLGILLVPSLMRVVFTQGSITNTFPFESEPRFHMLLAQNLDQLTTPEKTLFSPKTLFDNRHIMYGPSHYMLSWASFGNKHLLQFWSWILPIISGVLATLLLYAVFRRFYVEHSTIFMSLLALVLSPAFMHVFTVSLPDALAICTLLLSAYFFLSSRTSFFIVSLLFFVLGASLSLFHAFALLFFLILVSLHGSCFPHHKAKAFTGIIAILIVVLASKLPVYIPYTHLERGISTFIADFGGRAGFSVFFILLAAMGLVYSWKDKKNYVSLYLFLLFSIPSLLLYPHLMIYSSFVLAFFVGLALIRLKETSWQFPSVQQMTFLIIILGLLFSSVSYANRLKSASPSEELLDSLAFLKENSVSDDHILSHETLGVFIESVAHRPVLLDEADASVAFEQKKQDATVIFQSRNAGVTQSLLIQHNIRFIVITQAMKEGLVWEGPEQGLLFLLRDSETFKNVYSTSSIEIWEYTP